MALARRWRARQPRRLGHRRRTTRPSRVHDETAGGAEGREAVAGDFLGAMRIGPDTMDTMNSEPQISRSGRASLAAIAAACMLVAPARCPADCKAGYDLHAEYYTFGVGAKPASVATGDC